MHGMIILVVIICYKFLKSWITEAQKEEININSHFIQIKNN